MGTWGYGPFEDDLALDWVLELEEAEDWSVVENALRAAAETAPEEYLESPEGREAWAAAAVVVAADNRVIGLPDKVSLWLTAHGDTRPPELRRLASDALERVLGDESELVALWKESGRDEFEANVRTLASMLD
jgi:hypothetical protein